MIRDQENRLIRAFSSEVESGSRQENASKQESGVDQRFHEKLKDSRLFLGLKRDMVRA
jgi:hypothetical protein